MNSGPLSCRCRLQPNHGPHATPEVVLCGPRCNKFASRLFSLYFFIRLKYICHQIKPKSCTQNTCIINALNISQCFRFGLHTYKLATLRATIGLIFTSWYRIKLWDLSFRRSGLTSQALRISNMCTL